jgi:hypothetical protein
MSLFCVLAVVNKDDVGVGSEHGDFPKKLSEALTRLMAPYQQNNMGDCPEEYLGFLDRTDELIENVKLRY